MNNLFDMIGFFSSSVVDDNIELQFNDLRGAPYGEYVPLNTQRIKFVTT